MPALPITDDEVNGAARSRMVLAKIEAAMLWPDDAQARGQSWLYLFAVDQIGFQNWQIPPDVLPEAAAELRRVKGSIKDRRDQGEAAGQLLFYAILRSRKGDESLRMSNLQDELAEHFKLGKSAFRNVHLPRMRPVAHLWCTWFFRAQRYDDGAFPCRLERLPEFLAEARAFLDLATRTRTRQSPAFGIMNGAEAWTVPPGVELPDVEIGLDEVELLKPDDDLSMPPLE